MIVNQDFHDLIPNFDDNLKFYDEYLFIYSFLFDNSRSLCRICHASDYVYSLSAIWRKK